jgi:hypothetical protein
MHTISSLTNNAVFQRGVFGSVIETNLRMHPGTEARKEGVPPPYGGGR